MTFRNATTILILTAAATHTAAAQQLATYDPAAGPEELAAVACPPAPPLGWTTHLAGAPPAPVWGVGACAADNVNQRLYYCTGNAANGIQRVPFAGFGALPTNFSAPAGFNQITGMVVDPADATGNTLIVTDGFVLVRYHAPSATILAGPFAGPATLGSALTGLAHNPFNNRLYAIDDLSTMWSRPLGGGPWSPPVFPSVGVPGRATGIAFCQTAASPPFASYWNGIVRSPVTGVNVPFPPAPAGVRHHRGMTFLALSIRLGGGGDPVLRPRVEWLGGTLVGNPGTAIRVNTPDAPAILVVDFSGGTGPGVQIPGIGGSLLVNPGASATLGLPAGTHTIPLSLVGVPPGIGLTFQALGLNPNGYELSGAVHFRTSR